MPRFLDTSGKTPVAIAICARCSRKRPIGELMPDPNIKGLMCCREGFGVRYGSSACADLFDPYRLPARQPDKINLRFARPDVPLVPEE